MLTISGYHLTAQLYVFLMKLRAKNAEYRYQSADELKADLKSCMYQLTSKIQIDSFKTKTSTKVD